MGLWRQSNPIVGLTTKITGSTGKKIKKRRQAPALAIHQFDVKGC
jgi:hypothetical protein